VLPDLDSDVFLCYTADQLFFLAARKGGNVWDIETNSREKKGISSAFEPTSKRKHGYPSESAVKRGMRVIHGDKALYEKLGKEDLCPCGSGRRFQTVLSQ
jgi:hypothetical protein